MGRGGWVAVGWGVGGGGGGLVGLSRRREIGMLMGGGGLEEATGLE